MQGRVMPARITGDFPNWHLVPAGQAFAVFAMATPELARCHTSAVVRADEMTGRLDSKHASGKLPVAPLSAVPGRFGRWREEWSPTASSAVRRFWLAQKEVHPKRNCNPARATHENLNLSQNLRRNSLKKLFKKAVPDPLNTACLQCTVLLNELTSMFFMECTMDRR